MMIDFTTDEAVDSNLSGKNNPKSSSSGSSSSSQDDFNIRSVLNLGHAPTTSKVSNYQRSPTTRQRQQATSSNYIDIKSSSGRRNSPEKFSPTTTHKTTSTAAPHVRTALQPTATATMDTYLPSSELNSFYLADDDVEQEDHTRHFKSIHIPGSSFQDNRANYNQRNKTSSGPQQSQQQQLQNLSSNNNNSSEIKEMSLANTIELDSVKHKLSSIWNNVKYGWTNYLKKPNKINLDKDEPIVILGKIYNEQDRTGVASGTNASNDMTKCGYSSFYYCNDSNVGLPTTSVDLESNYSIINQPEDDHANQKKTTTAPVTLRPSKSHQQQQYSQRCKNEQEIASSARNSLVDNLNLTMTYSILSSSSSFISNLLPKSLSSDSLTKINNNNNGVFNCTLRLVNENMTTPLEQEIYSRLWFTYRKDFAPLYGNNNVKYTSDCGWGCMLRSGQMLVAQGLLQHAFGSDWSLYSSLKSAGEIATYREIISLFNDRPDLIECPFGIHNLLDIADRNEMKAATPNKKTLSSNSEASPSRVGTWFGPTSVCLLMRDAIKAARLSARTSNESISKLLKGIRIYVAQDCTVYKQDVINLCTSSADSSFVPCLLLVPVRLGGDSINDIYVNSLKMFFEMSKCIGMIGGKPKHSLYFIGYQDEKVIYLDPHICQPTVHVYARKEPIHQRRSAAHEPNANNQFSRSYSSSPSPTPPMSCSSELFDNSSFHCANPNRIEFSKLDPSLAIGFYIRTLDDLNSLCDIVKQTSNSEFLYPIFSVCDETFEKTQLHYESLCLDENHLVKTDNGGASEGRSRSSTSGSISTIKSNTSEQQQQQQNKPQVNNQQPKNNASPLNSQNKSKSNSYLLGSGSNFKQLTSKFRPNSASQNIGGMDNMSRGFFSNFSKERTKASTSSSSSSSSKSKHKKSDQDDFVLV